MRSVVLLLALAIFGVAAPQGPDSPGLTLYRQLGLPLPPRDAELVVLKESYISIGDAAGTIEPKAVAWRIRTPKGNMYMGGPATVSARKEDRYRYDGWEKALPASETEALKFQMVVCNMSHPFEADTTLGFALQAESMGMVDLSKKILSGQRSFSRSRELSENASVESRVWLIAYQVTLAGFLEENFDRNALTGRLEAFAEHLPKREFGMVAWSLKSLRASLRPSTAKPGTTEWLIDQWVSSRRTRGSFFGLDLGLLDPVLSRGLPAVPELIAHLEDDRATLIHQGRFNNSYPHFQTVGSICSELLAQLMSGRFVNRGSLYNDQKPEEWWKETRAKDERKYLESVLFPDPKEVKELAGGFFDTVPTNPVALRMLQLRHPNSIPNLYKRCLKLDGVMSRALAQALFESAIPASQKAAIFKEAAESKTAEHRSTAVHLMKALGAEPLGPILVKALSVPRPFGDGSYGTSPAESLARQVLSSNSSEAIEALAKAMKGAELGYRFEAMSAFRYLGDDKLGVATQRLVFDLLEQFKDDDELYDPSKHAFGYLADEAAKKDKWQRSSALSEYKTPLAARDLAFVCIAELLGDEGERSNSWNRDQWAQFRTRIRAKLAEWRVKHGGAPLPDDVCR